MMQALARRGHAVALLTVVPPRREALDGLDLAFCTSLAAAAASPPVSVGAFRLTAIQRRFLRYWGIDPLLLPTVAQTLAAWPADAVIAVGTDVLPSLAAVKNTRRIWYAADDPAWHELSQVRVTEPATWGRLRDGVINGLYERVFAEYVDRIWVVTPQDRQVSRLVSGVGPGDVIANGVDSDYYRPCAARTLPHSCVFWGRLDFGPNVQALTWFCEHVWPALRREVADARLAVYGRCPVAEVQALARENGISLTVDVPDLPPEIARHQVVVLPFVSGGGIKNKLLEAASMGRTIVCSPRACLGLKGRPPLLVARQPKQWVATIRRLWSDDAQRKHLGEQARSWVQQHHTWDAAARAALVGLGTTGAGRAIHAPSTELQVRESA
jgi:glycosyltransferase involved in cell wall biosynthesis